MKTEFRLAIVLFLMHYSTKQALFGAFFNYCFDYVTKAYIIPFFFHSIKLESSSLSMKAKQTTLSIKGPIELSEDDQIVPSDEEQTGLSSKEDEYQQPIPLDDEDHQTILASKEENQMVTLDSEKVGLSTNREEQLPRTNNSSSCPVKIITCSPLLIPQSGPSLTISTKRPEKKRHNSVSISNDFDLYSPFSALPTLSPSTSASSQCSTFSFCSTDSAQSKVEEIINRFETGTQHIPQRRYSVDSFHLTDKKKPLIPLRRFEFEPIKGEWEKRDRKDHSINLRPSQST
ncbi:hypothetical protein BD560DRAFT_414869 [Blakeslea trispora]|nr:hypothetical protein BD560DRAFT_414869 [Blakeslea trispora]